MSNPDMFAELFAEQKQLNQRIGVETDSMTEEEQVTWVLNYCRAMTQELAELTDSVPWKWWAKYQKFDEQNARVEVVDLFHFLQRDVGRGLRLGGGGTLEIRRVLPVVAQRDLILARFG